MKCEICHLAEAKEAIRKTVNGVEQELYVCHDCALKARGAAAAPVHADPPPASGASAVPGEVPIAQASIRIPPGVNVKGFAGDLASLVCMMLEATFKILGRKSTPSEWICPCCGTTRAEFRKDTRVGCMMCYELFREDVDRYLADLQQGKAHVGKVPKNAPKAEELQSLFDQLKQALLAHDLPALNDLAKRIEASGSLPAFGGNRSEERQA